MAQRLFLQAFFIIFCCIFVGNALIASDTLMLRSGAQKSLSQELTDCGIEYHQADSRGATALLCTLGAFATVGGTRLMSGLAPNASSRRDSLAITAGILGVCGAAATWWQHKAKQNRLCKAHQLLEEGVSKQDDRAVVSFQDALNDNDAFVRVLLEKEDDIVRKRKTIIDRRVTKKNGGYAEEWRWVAAPNLLQSCIMRGRNENILPLINRGADLYAGPHVLTCADMLCYRLSNKVDSPLESSGIKKVLENACFLQQNGLCDFKRTVSLLYGGRSLLHLTARYGDTEDLVKACDLGCDINGPDSEGRTPLFYSGRIDNTCFLIEKGADVTKKTLAGKSILDETEDYSKFPLFIKEMLTRGLSFGANSQCASLFLWWMSTRQNDIDQEDDALIVPILEWAQQKDEKHRLLYYVDLKRNNLLAKAKRGVSCKDSKDSAAIFKQLALAEKATLRETDREIVCTLSDGSKVSIAKLC